MPTQAESLFNNAELSLAAYADLTAGVPTSSQILKLKEAGMSEKEATEFALRYTSVIAVIPNTLSGFSATVFADSNGNLTVAIRGTEVENAPDLSTADIQIANPE